MTTYELKIEGMHCGHCVMSVRQELSKLPHVIIEDVQVGRALVQYDETRVSPDDLAHAIEEAGYRLQM